MSCRFLALAGAMLFLVTAAGAVGPDVTPLDDDPDYRAARRWIEEKNFPDAIGKLEVLLKREPTSPIILNWLAFSHRKLKNYPLSKIYYDAALRSDPTYLPALEYQGEWFLETGDMTAAKANLARLAALCGRCHEWSDLAEAIAAVEKGTPDNAAKPR